MQGIVSCSSPVASSSVEKETYVFAIREGDTLRLDKYVKADEDAAKPCVIFVFGGGFVGGSRDSDYNSAFMQRLVENGYVAIAIDYRLGMKNAQMDSEFDPMQFGMLMQHTIQIAVEDLYAATRFVYEHADEWQINKDWIVACGSSAGAITVLQGEYLICNHSELTQILPVGFRYGGIISFAGAIFNMGDELTWSTTPSPIQLFHGDADRNVPYDKAIMESMGGLFGSKYIADQLRTLKTPYCFYEIGNAAHEIAGVPMEQNLEEINSFIRGMVIDQKPYMIHTGVKDMNRPETEKAFTLIDYITANYQ